MNRSLLFFASLVAALLGLTPGNGLADSQLSSERLDVLDQWGCFTPGFKAAVHEFVDVKKSIVAAKNDETVFSQKTPDLQKQAADAEAKVAALQKESALYDRSDESDFAALKKIMSDTGASPEEQRVLAQTFVWSYPASPHLAEAQEYLQKLEKAFADETQAEKDAEAEREAARAKLIQRAQARQLSLAEWRDFLRDMTEEDVLKYLGRPEVTTEDYWMYEGEWTVDPDTQVKIGLQVNFNAGHVSSISDAPTKPQ